MIRSILSFACLAFLPLGAVGQELSELAATQQAKLESALHRLQEQRARIQSAQLPLAEEFNESEREAVQLREEFSRLQRTRDSRSFDLDTLGKELETARKEQDYITRTLFSDYAATYEASLSPGELATYGAALRERNLFLENVEASEGERLERSLRMLSGSLERIRTAMGGKRYAGEALTEEGLLVAGQYIQVGPLLYFVDDSGQSAGWVEDGQGLQPKLVATGSDAEAHLTQLAQSGEGQLPIDPTLGNALALEQTRDSFWEHLRKGGIWVAPIMGFALVATLVALLKLVQIYSIRQPSPLVAHDIVRALREGDQVTARELAVSQPEPTASMLANAVDHADESVDLVEEVMYESMLNTQPKLERFLNVIAVTAAIGPLLGLLGTVTGIIKTFKLMNVFGAGDPKPLISGISEALITTELGLVLAIPALIIHALLSRKVAGVMARMEKLAVAYINGLSRTSGAAEEKERFAGSALND